MATNPNATVTSVAASASAVTLFAEQSYGVAGRSIYNDSSADLYVKFGTAASETSFTVKVAAAGYFEVYPVDGESYDGIITGIWSSATGAARLTEVA